MPGSADFDHIVLAGQRSRKRCVGLLALHDPSYRVVDLRHAAGDLESHRLHGTVASNGDRHQRGPVGPLRHLADRFDPGVKLDLPGPRFRVLDELDVGVGASEQLDSTRGAQRLGKQVALAIGSRGGFTLGGFLIELTSDGPKPLFPSRLPLFPSRLLLFRLDTRSLLACCCLSRGFLSSSFASRGFLPRSVLSRSFLAFGLLSRGLDTGRLLASCFLPLRLQLGGCLSRGFLSCSFPSRGFLSRGFLARSFLPGRFLSRGFLPRGFLAFRLLSRGLLSRSLDTGRLPMSRFLPLRLQLGGCLSRGFLTLGLLPRGGFDTDRLLTSR